MTVALKDCKKGIVYRLKARNIRLGVFDGKAGFIGIREKFKQRFLDTEYHREGESYQTADPLEAVASVPVDIMITDHLDTCCETCGKRVEWATTWVHLIADTSHEADPVSRMNHALFEFLSKLEEEQP